MDKRYQVFISSTYIDLQEERREVIQALLELDCIPSGMELFPAANEDQWSLIKRVIDDCDYYIVIVGGRYGSETDAGLSYTQMEYEYAVSIGKPVLGFVHANPDQIPSGKSDRTEEKLKKLEAFRELVRKKMIKSWDTPESLGAVVSRGLINLIKTQPAVGWIRADQISDTAARETIGLRKRIDELENLLSESRSTPPPGTDTLAQGDDTVRLAFTCRVELEKKSYSYSDIRLSSDPTWNQVFASIAPTMLHEADEQQLRSSLGAFVMKIAWTRIFAYTDDKGNKVINAFDLRIDNESFDRVKVQLRALGLIKRSEKPRSVKNTNLYWTLTPFGDDLINRLLAARKPPKVIRASV